MLTKNTQTMSVNSKRAYMVEAVRKMLEYCYRHISEVKWIQTNEVRFMFVHEIHQRS